MLSFSGSPAVIEDTEIEAVRICLTYGTKPEAHPFLEKGDLVRVKAGALRGLEGVVTRHKNQSRIVVSIALIHKSISAEIDVDLLEPLEHTSDSLPVLQEA
jgi:transcription antitermination factor NusG